MLEQEHSLGCILFKGKTERLCLMSEIYNRAMCLLGFGHFGQQLWEHVSKTYADVWVHLALWEFN